MVFSYQNNINLNLKENLKMKFVNISLFLPLNFFKKFEYRLSNII